MKIIVEFNLESDLTRLEQKKLRMLLMDALYEFSAHRTPASQYVAERYNGNVFEWLDKAQKVGQVIKRNRIAKLLHSGINRVYIKEEIL